MKILSVSDVEVGFIYSPMVCDRFGDVDLVLSCGDLPYFYLEYIQTMLNKRLYFVRGNHASKVEYGLTTTRSAPLGAVDLNQKAMRDESGLLLAGLEGSLQYNRGPHQYSQSEYWQKALLLAPLLLWNKSRYGRYLDVFISHAPPWKIHDADDPPHTGIKAFRWLIKVFQPAYFIHGHIHVYRNDTVTRTQIGATTVLNTYGFKELTLDLPVTGKEGVRPS